MSKPQDKKNILDLYTADELKKISQIIGFLVKRSAESSNLGIDICATFFLSKRPPVAFETRKGLSKQVSKKDRMVYIRGKKTLLCNTYGKGVPRPPNIFKRMGPDGVLVVDDATTESLETRNVQNTNTTNNTDPETESDDESAVEEEEEE